MIAWDCRARYYLPSAQQERASERENVCMWCWGAARLYEYVFGRFKCSLTGGRVYACSFVYWLHMYICSMCGIWMCVFVYARERIKVGMDVYLQLKYKQLSFSFLFFSLVLSVFFILFCDRLLSPDILSLSLVLRATWLKLQFYSIKM